MIERVAPAMHQARFFGGVTSPAAAMAIMLTGHELGLPPAASFRLIHVIDGRPSLSPKGALAVLRRSGLLEGLEIAEAPGACTVTMRRRGGEAYTLTWTLDDARRAGVVRPNGGWDRYPQNMLRWRTIGYVADVLFPDVLGGLHRADEYGAAIDESGDVVRQPGGVDGCDAPDARWAAPPVQPLRSVGPGRRRLPDRRGRPGPPRRARRALRRGRRPGGGRGRDPGDGGRVATAAERLRTGPGAGAPVAGEEATGDAA